MPCIARRRLPVSLLIVCGAEPSGRRMRIDATDALWRGRCVLRANSSISRIAPLRRRTASTIRQYPPQAALRGPRTYLALSGGGADGAYGAGVLIG